MYEMSFFQRPDITIITDLHKTESLAGNFS